MSDDRVRGRYRVQGGSLDAETVVLDARQARHMTVRRLEPGARVVLFDGAGAEAEARLLELQPSTATVRVLERRPATSESALRLWLVQGLPVKLPRVDDVVRQATELGVSGILPVLGAHSEVPGGGPEVLRRKAERWRRVAEEAAKQCGRGLVPEVADPVAWAGIPWERLPGPALLLDPGGEPFAAGLGAAGAEASLLVGPEGGWSEVEMDDALGRGARILRLGPRTLRADSAGPAALAVIQHLWGDLD